MPPAVAREAAHGFRPAKGHLVNIGGTLINPDYIVTAHMEPGVAPDPARPNQKPPDALVMTVLTAGQLRFTGKEADELWADLNQVNE